jgi:hypothetical protein
MPNISTCPGFSLFEQLAQGLLPEPAKESLLEHLEGCQACAQRVGNLPAGDTLVDLIRQADTLSADAEPAAVGPLMEKLRQLGPATLTPGETPTHNVRGPAVSSETIGLPPDKDRARYDFLAPPEEPDELGRLGPYRVLAVLGLGGMGVVFKAEDPRLQRQVALKAMLPAMARDPLSKERFLREARAAAAVKHHHVVTIYEVDEDRGVPFIALELLQGESLEERLARAPKLSRKEILRIGREIVEGLAAAHEMGLVHRDIKPANIWLEGLHSHVKILDFGLACASSYDARLTQTGVIVGTPAYMCPEQASGGNPDARGDLFSLGSVLYRMCTGEVPFQAPDAISTLVAVVCHEPRAVDNFDPSLPEPLGDLVAQLLEKKPNDRPSSASAVAQTIADLERGKSPPLATRPRRTAADTIALTPGRRRRPVVWGALAALVLLALGGFWLGLVLFRPEKAQGTVVVDTEDQVQVQVQITQAGKEVTVIDTRINKLTPNSFTVPSGERVVLEVRCDPKDSGFPAKKGPKGKGDFPGPPDGPWGDDGPGPPKKGPKDKGEFFGPGKGGPDKKGFGPKGPPPDNGQGGKNANMSAQPGLPDGPGFSLRKGPPKKD